MNTNAFNQALLDHLFLNADIANVGDATGLRGSSTAGSFYWALYTQWPGRGGNQSTNETTYTGYSRKAGARNSGGFVRSGQSISPAADVEFDQCTGGASQDVTHFSVGVASSGAGLIIRMGVFGTALGPFTAATSDTITIPGLSGLSVGDMISFYAVGSSSLPTGITEGTVYFAKTVSGDAVTISATSGGSTLDITGVGDGIAFRNTKISCYEGVRPVITTSSVLLEG